MRLRCAFDKMELGDQIIAVPIGENAEEFHGVIKLNETAAFIFELLKVDTTETAIVEQLMTEYDAPRNVIETDVHRYIETFIEHGMLVL